MKISFDAEAYERELELFAEEREIEIYLAKSGQKDSLELSPIYKKYRELFTRAKVEQILAVWQERKDRRVQHIAQEVVQGYIKNATKKLDEEYHNALGAAKISWAGAQISYHNAWAQILREKDFRARHALFRLVVDVEEGLTSLRRQNVEIQLGLTRELGFDSFIEMCSRLQDIDFARLSQTIRATIERIMPVYQEVLRQELESVGVPREERHVADLGFLRGAPAHLSYFQPEKLFEVFENSLLAMGLDWRTIPGFTIDAEEREKKSARAFMVAPKVPERVILCVKPSPGRMSYAALFHEGGHGLFYASINPDLPYAFRGLGNMDVSETWAFWAENLTYDILWAQEFLGMPEKVARAYCRSQLVVDMMLFMRYSAKFLYELEMYQNSESAPYRYQELLETISLLKTDGRRWIHDIDAFFYDTAYLLAWYLQPMVEHALQSRFGQQWFRDPGAGAFMKELWRNGNLFSPSEIATNLGLIDLQPRFLEERFLSVRS